MPERRRSHPSEPRPLVVRADGGREMGSGHVTRCYALAQAWARNGGAVTFVGRTEDGGFRRRAEAAGFGFDPLERRHPDPADLRTTLEVLAAHRASEGRAPWLVTDGYTFTPTYHAAVREAGFPLLVVDDTAHLPVYHADVVLNQNLGAERYGYVHDPDTVLLLGTRYALLREQFDGSRSGSGGIPEVPRRVLVTMGGSDPENVTLRVLRSLREVGIPGLEIVAVAGAGNPHLETLEREAAEVANVRIVRDVSDMAGLMRDVDLAISAAGSTSWELAATGVPSILLVVADNQRGIARGLHEEGAARSLGWHREVSEEALVAAAREISSDREIRARMRSRARALVDGRGAGRVVRAMAGRAALTG